MLAKLPANGGFGELLPELSSSLLQATNAMARKGIIIFYKRKFFGQK
jgi:hypothetical protein